MAFGQTSAVALPVLGRRCACPIHTQIGVQVFGRRPSLTVAWGKRSAAPGNKRARTDFGRRPSLTFCNAIWVIMAFSQTSMVVTGPRAAVATATLP